MAWWKIALKMMNVTNNKRYFVYISIWGMCLGTCSALFAQELVADKIANKSNAAMRTHSAASVASFGVASYYGAEFQGHRTASGEIFNATLMTAAHRTLPFGTQLKVTNLRNKKSVVVHINDRGPHVRGRVIDLSKAAARKIGITRTGTARVKLEVL
jgi:rare lipoprotein A